MRRETENADTDQGRAREVEDDDDGGVGECDERGGPSEEICVWSARGIAGQDAKSGSGDVEDGGEDRDAPVAPHDRSAVDLISLSASFLGKAQNTDQQTIAHRV